MSINGLDWVTTLKAAEILGCHRSRVGDVADAANVRRRTLPGISRVYYAEPDLRRVAAGAVVGGGGVNNDLQAAGA